MARLSTCKKCTKQITASEKYIFSGKSYCEDCYKILRRDADAFKELIDHICKKFEIIQPTGLILKQVKEYKNELKYSYAAMTYTLWYIEEILRKELELKYGIAIVKYYYEEARHYYEQQEKITNSITDVEIQTKIVKNNKSSPVNKLGSLVDISKIIEGGDINKF